MKHLFLCAAAAATLSTPAAAEPPRTLEPFLSEVQLSPQEQRDLARVIEQLTTQQRQAYMVALQRIDSRIVGGAPREIADHPWQVALVEGGLDQRYQFCGGSLIAPTVVVTAAHCIVNRIVLSDPARVDVVAGTRTFSQGGERLRARALFVHPNYDTESQDYDVAIIVLAAPSTLAQPAEISDEPVAVGTTAWVTGWGAVQEGGMGTTDLLGAEIPVIDNPTCNARQSYNGRITDRMLCAGLRGGGVDSCQGDSGGPLTAGRRLVGVVSWGYGCARALRYGVYTRVSSVAPWIRSFLTP